MNFVKPFEDEDGNVVFDHKRIAKGYVGSAWFLFDVLSVLPFEMFAPNAGNIAAIKTLKLFRLTRISKVLKRVMKNAKTAGAGLQARSPAQLACCGGSV